MVYRHRAAAKAVTARLEAIRDELVAGVNPTYVVRRIWDLVDDIESAAALPSIRGAAPDDSWEELNPEFVADPQGWPESFDPECDGYVWEPNFDGPTPDSVLAESAPFNADYDAWLDRIDASLDCWTEVDQLAAHGTV